MEIIWAKSALTGLRKIYEYIYENSPKNADHIVDEISDKVSALKSYPERYKPDNYKRNNTEITELLNTRKFAFLTK